jgi:hypothetical protein
VSDSGLSPFTPRKEEYVKIHKVIQRRFRRIQNGVNVAGDVNAVVSGNVGERGSSVTHVSSSQHIKQDTQSTPPRRKED